MYRKLKFEVEYLTDEHLTGFESYKVNGLILTVNIFFISRDY